MNLLRSHAGVVLFAIVPLACMSSLLADSIDNAAGGNALVIGTAPDLVIDDTPGSPLAGYFVFGYDPNFGDLGLIPGSFLFGGNTSYDYTGSQVVSIVSAITDPGQSILPLNDPSTIVVTFTIPGNAPGDASDPAETLATPEPAAEFLVLTGGLGLIALYAGFRVRRLKFAAPGSATVERFW